MQVTVGPPVDLDDLRGRSLDTATLKIATERLIAAITAQVEVLRGETAPEDRYDLRAHRAAEGTPQTDGEGTRS
jgi:hypothetical protein